MKYTIFLLVCIGFIFLSTSDLWADQTLQDVVYLKNGSIIRGIIIEQVPNQSLKIQTNDGNIFVYKIDEVDKITKEPPTLRKPNGGKKSPAIAFVLSFIVLPGAGQIYNGEPSKGVAQLLLVATGYGIAISGANKDDTGMAGGGLLLALGCSLWSWIDAPTSASRINAERGYSQMKKPNRHVPLLSLSPIDIRTGAFDPKIKLTFKF